MNMSRRPNKRILTALACAAGGAVGYGAYKYYAVNYFFYLTSNQYKSLKLIRNDDRIKRAFCMLLKNQLNGFKNCHQETFKSKRLAKHQNTTYLWLGVVLQALVLPSMLVYFLFIFWVRFKYEFKKKISFFFLE